MTGVWALRALWWTVRRTRWWKAMEWQCGKRGPVDTWIPDGGEDGGYFRGGIQANYCLRFRDHGGQCVGNWNPDGTYQRYGARYTPPAETC